MTRLRRRDFLVVIERVAPSRRNVAQSKKRCHSRRSRAATPRERRAQLAAPNWSRPWILHPRGGGARNVSWSLPRCPDVLCQPWARVTPTTDLWPAADALDREPVEFRFKQRLVSRRGHRARAWSEEISCGTSSKSSEHRVEEPQLAFEVACPPFAHTVGLVRGFLNDIGLGGDAPTVVGVGVLDDDDRHASYGAHCLR